MLSLNFTKNEMLSVSSPKKVLPELNAQCSKLHVLGVLWTRAKTRTSLISNLGWITYSRNRKAFQYR